VIVIPKSGGAAARPPRWLRSLPCLFLLALTIPGARPAAARDLVLSVAPQAPIWGEEVVLSVRGAGCGATLSAPRITVGLLNDRSIDVDLLDDCRAASPSAFQLVSALGDLIPGLYEIRVHDVREEGISRLTFTVRRSLSLDVVPQGIATDHQPVKLLVGSYARCRGYLPKVEGSVITITYFDSCLFPSFVPGVVYTEIDLGVLPAGTYEVRVGEFFPNGFTPPQEPLRAQKLTLRVWDHLRCVPTPTRLCLGNGRFAVSATWRVGADSGVGHPQPLEGNEQTGMLWFFGPDTVELTVKLLDACALNQRWWVYISSSSTVEYDVAVLDTATGVTRHYPNAYGHTPSLVADSSSFHCATSAGVSR
jgi:hypothetical protein